MPGDPEGSGAGNSNHTPLYYKETEDLAGELNLSPGDILQARVVSRLSGHKSRILLSLRGRQVVAASKLNVKPGDNLIVRVQSVTHPLELKIYEPQEALKNLSRDQLSGILSEMQLKPTDRLLEAANKLLEADIHLDSDLLKMARNHWDELTGGEEKIQPGRFRALRFLHGLQVPVNKQVLSTVGAYLETEKSSESWQPVLDGANLVSPEKMGSFFNLVKGLGIDLVRQLGKRPATASRTLHARLLKKMAKNEGEDSAVYPLIGQLLGLALGSLATENEFYLRIPFYLGGRIKELPLWVKIGDSHEEWEIPDWSLSGHFSFDWLGEIRFDINCSRERLGCIFTSANQPVIDLIKKHAPRLIKPLERGGYNVQFKYRQKDPAPPPGPFSREKENNKSSVGKVDFMA
ncbi:MAG: hypothetical protein ACQEP7_00900 [bacterium]